MDLKVITLNIWRYYHWDERKKEAIKFLKEQDADIVFIQEAAYDERLKGRFANQIQEINQELKYKDFNFFETAKMTKWHEKPIDWIMSYGLGILSKYPIIHAEKINLPHIKKNKDFGFTHTIVECQGKKINLINVHFENTDEGSKEHLKFVIEWCKKRGICPIIAGDFNMLNTNNLMSIADKDYLISYKIKPYKSFMPTEFSAQKEPITLDYIIAQKDNFGIKEIECVQNDASDHNPVIAIINLK